MRSLVVSSSVIHAALSAVVLLYGSTAPAAAQSAAGKRGPAVPAGLEAPAGHVPYLTTRALGTQNYICLPAATGVGWVHLGPQATLFNRAGRELTTHFLSVNPREQVARATWQDSNDSSSVWAAAVASSSDPAWVAPGAIPWLLLEAVGVQRGPTGGRGLSRTTFIQRVNTVGGVAPGAGCTTTSQIGARAFVPYRTDYVFYRAHGAAW